MQGLGRELSAGAFLSEPREVAGGLMLDRDTPGIWDFNLQPPGTAGGSDPEKNPVATAPGSDPL